MVKLAKVISFLIILLGLVHVLFAFPLYANTDTLWFVGAGLAIIFAGLLNFVALDRDGSRFTMWVAAVVNSTMCALFCYAINILNEPQVYVGVAVFLIAAVAFVSQLLQKKRLGLSVHDDR
ncbi:MAG: hypothetical protein EOO16_11115 [Chitinophagaceae bacterium]|nr:MAG: hypothetical protein EOO16_11115 [Chitinophagaceae bacterium]